MICVHVRCDCGVPITEVPKTSDRGSCVRLGIIIGENRARVGAWRRDWPDVTNNKFNQAVILGAGQHEDFPRAKDLGFAWHRLASSLAVGLGTPWTASAHCNTSPPAA